jgi:hypothetical protein
MMATTAAVDLAPWDVVGERVLSLLLILMSHLVYVYTGR